MRHERVAVDPRKNDRETMDEFLERLSAVLETVKGDELDLTIGDWPGVGEGRGAEKIVDHLVQLRRRFELRAIHLGDVTTQMTEVSWVQPGRVEKLWANFPGLEFFRVRGSPTLGKLVHARLKKIWIECSGLSAHTVAELAEARLPELEELRLYIGTSRYGRSTEARDLLPLLSGKLFPKLVRLGLMNAENADEVAEAVASSPVLDRLEELDLSLGTLGDEGARALIASPGVRRLRKLDIDHHFISEELVEQLRKLGPSVVGGGSEERNPNRYRGGAREDGRYVDVGE